MSIEKLDEFFIVDKIFCTAFQMYDPVPFTESFQKVIGQAGLC